MPAIYPSLIAADLLNLQNEIARLGPYCDGYHIDVMDNHYVPNLTMGPDFVNAIARIAPKPVWVHLMVDKPENLMERLILPPGSILTIHFEKIEEILHIIKHIKEKKWMPGIAIKPKTPVDEIFPLLDKIHQVTIMSVEPGFSGQPFLKSTVTKIEPLIGYRATGKLKFRIAMDGGIGPNNIVELTQKGVDDFVIGAGLFRQPDPVFALQELKRILSK